MVVRSLGELEAEIMDRLWSWGRPATVREVVDDLNAKRPVAYTTVMTVAGILHTKGLLNRHKAGRAWVYEPARSRDSYTATLMQEALGSTSDTPAALAHFVEQISTDEVAALRRALAALDAAEHDDRTGER
ncbi:BlaI/MecI/CopY family transcriptional regulator [Kitasatospora sp. NPDC101801]|uniref:BlaI/MecI/CopY family transcriptional regulator n=1 Tax=Kitasatospora sp. NPDC101801 TaxID=3364103 RepID=UPI00382E62C2